MSQRLERLLATLERYTKMDLTYLLRGSFWSTVGQFAVSGSSLFLSIIIARYVSKDAYGIYKYIISIVAILSSFSLSGLASALLPSIAEGHDGEFIHSVRSSLRWSVAVFFGAFALAGYYFMQGNPELAFGILIGGLTSPFIAAYGLYNPFLAGKKDFARQALYGGVLVSIIPAIFIAITAVLYPKPAALASVYFISILAVIVYAYVQTMRTYRPDATKRDGRSLVYGKHLSFINILGSIAGNIDQVLLFHYSSAVDLAIYNFATGVVDQTKGPIKTLDSMMQARFAKHTDADIASSINNKSLWLLAAAVIFIALYIPAAPYVYGLLFPTYLSAVPYSQVYALSLISMMFYPAASYIGARRKVRSVYIYTIVNSIIQIVAMAVGVVFWGLWGIIGARVVTRLVGAAVPQILYLFG